MKHRLKGLLALMLSLTMLLSMVVTASAEQTMASSVSVNGVTLNSTTPYWVNGASTATSDPTGYNAYFDAATGTLTLNGATIGGTGIRCEQSQHGNYIIVLVGNSNTVTTTSGSAIVSETGSVTIQGNGTLNATGYANGIWAEYTVAISGDATVNVTGTTGDGIVSNAPTSGDGVKINTTGTVTITGKGSGMFSKGVVEIENGTVTAKVTSIMGKGISAGNVTIEGGTVTAGNVVNSDDEAYGAFGIYATSAITISGGTVNATGTDGIVADNGTVTISDGEVTATATSSGIYGGNTVTISGGKVEATATNENTPDPIWGIYGYNKVTIEGGAKVEANATNTTGVGIGTYYSKDSAHSGDSIVISGEGTEVEVGCQTGLSSYKVFVLENSKLTVDTATTSAIACGTLHFFNDTHINKNWYQWKADNNPVQTSSDNNQLSRDGASNAKTLTIEPIRTVKFDANGGSGTMADVTGVSGNYTLPANGFTAPAGKEFIGWSADPAGAEKRSPGEQMPITSSLTLYAIWKETTSNGGGTPDTVMPNYPVPITPVNPTPDETIKTESAETFDSGIALSVAVTILSATGGAWLAKKKD